MQIRLEWACLAFASARRGVEWPQRLASGLWRRRKGVVAALGVSLAALCANPANATTYIYGSGPDNPLVDQSGLDHYIYFIIYIPFTLEANAVYDISTPGLTSPNGTAKFQSGVQGSGQPIDMVTAPGALYGGPSDCPSTGACLSGAVGTDADGNIYEWNLTVSNGGVVGIHSYDVPGLGSQNTIGTNIRNTANGSVGGWTTLAVPEPGTWMIMLLGFASIGAMVRRQRLVTGFSSTRAA